MKKKLLVLVAVLVVLLVGIFGFKIFFIDKGGEISALRVDSMPKTDVYVNDQKVGQTPYSIDKMKPGDYKIKLIAASGVMGTYSVWETKVKLTDGGLTYINRNLADTLDNQSGQIIWLTKLLSNKNSELTVVSEPDSSSVAVDGVDKGNSSINISDVAAGDHEITVSKQGFGDQVVSGKLINGWRLNVIVKLAPIISGLAPTPMPTASPSATIIPYVVIKNTPLGFLRVRSEANLTSSESGRVKPTEQYIIVTESNGWTKIKSATTSAILGWVSDDYVEKRK